MALRKKIVKLAKMVGGLPGRIFTIDENAPEYYALECVVSDEQADVALAMGLRKERTAEECKMRQPLRDTETCNGTCRSAYAKFNKNSTGCLCRSCSGILR